MQDPIQCATPVEQERHYAENPEAAEALMRERHRRLAKLQQHLREHPEENAYGQHRRAQAKAAGMLVVPMKLLKKQARDPRLVLTGRRGALRLTPIHVLKAKARPTTTSARRRTNGTSGRPRAAATRSSARSGDSPDDDPAPAPAAARDAVAAAWIHILRRNQPGVAWEVAGR